MAGATPIATMGRDGARYDTPTGLNWLSVRTYVPTLGRFLSRDPLGRAPLFFADNPYVYAGNNPLSNVDPSGQYRAGGSGSLQRESSKQTNRMMARIAKKRGCDKACQGVLLHEALVARLARARAIARAAAAYFSDEVTWSGPTNAAAPAEDVIQQFLEAAAASSPVIAASLPMLAGLAGMLGGVMAAGAFVFGAVGAGYLAYKFVAFLAEQVFKLELTENDAFWLNANNVASFAGWSRVIIGTIVGVIGMIFIPLAMAYIPLESYMWVGIEAGLAIGVVNVLGRMTTYYDEEEQAFGYSQS